MDAVQLSHEQPPTFVSVAALRLGRGVVQRVPGQQQQQQHEGKQHHD